MSRWYTRTVVYIGGYISVDKTVELLYLMEADKTVLGKDVLRDACIAAEEAVISPFETRLLKRGIWCELRA